jgi:8-oxo-dGTP pyrophosphatase MutT (NUDIX family)
LDCALRETVEEAGINLTGITPMAYHKLSVGEYFFFEVDGELDTTINDDREISEVRWLPLKDIADLPCNVDVNNFLDRLDRNIRRP